MTDLLAGAPSIRRCQGRTAVSRKRGCYQLANGPLADRVVAARVERADAYALRWSDHAPVIVEYA